MTKTKAERKRNDAIKRLQDKIHFCQRRGDFVGVIQHQKELNKLVEVEQVKIRSTLLDCIKEQSEEERREITTRVIYAIAIGDILLSAIGDVESYMRSKFGITDISTMDALRKSIALLQNAVKSIDNVGSSFFSENYMNIVDEIEMQWEASLKTSALNKLLKASRATQGNVI